MNSDKEQKRGDQEAFDKNWKTRPETDYIHWTKGEPENQIQLAFRSHWNLFQEIMKDKVQGNRVLEVGCGRGSMSAYFADNGYDCTLLDSSENVIDTAKRIFKNHKLNAKFDVGDALELPYQDESFDLVVSIGLLEHFKDIRKPLEEQIRILDKGGLFLGYIVPHYEENVQNEYNWINDLLKGVVNERTPENIQNKEEIFRSDSDSKPYIEVLKSLSVDDINASGVYPLPMISYSTDFPFTLLNKESEHTLVKHFQSILDKRKVDTGKNPWLCEEGFGQAFLVWCFKK